MHRSIAAGRRLIVRVVAYRDYGPWKTVKRRARNNNFRVSGGSPGEDSKAPRESSKCKFFKIKLFIELS